VSATELAALIVAIASVVAVVLLVLCLAAVTKTLKVVRDAVELMRDETVPAMADLGETARRAGAELERVDVLVGRAQSISGTLDAGSRLAYLAFSSPVIKALALASGTGRAASRFRTIRKAR
jgi:hypothetical protein